MKRDILWQPLEISFAFLSITLLSPISRSHHFIFWLFPLITIVWLYSQPQLRNAKFFLTRCFYLALVFYAAQVLPYGKAAGMGAWANLTLWAGFALCLLNPQSPGTVPGTVPGKGDRSVS